MSEHPQFKMSFNFNIFIIFSPLHRLNTGNWDKLLENGVETPHPGTRTDVSRNEFSYKKVKR